MTRFATTWITAVLALISLARSPAHAADVHSPGTSALEAARRAYAAAAPFQETLEMTLEMPDGATRSHRHEYGVTGDGRAFFILSGEDNASLTVVAEKGRAVAEWSHVPGRYAEVAYDGTLVEGFQRLQAEQANIAVPAPLAAAQGAGREDFMEALRFAVLGPLTIGGVERRREGGGEVLEVTVTAANGRAVLGLDPATHRFETIRFSLGEGEQQVRGTGSFHFEPGPPADAPAWPDLSGRVAVASLPALEAPDLPLGEVVPGVELRDPTGAVVRLEDLRGDVVVLDFWATWCVPCWQGLERTEELAAWAATSGLPVRVFAVDTLERATEFDDQKELAIGLLKSRGLDVPLLLDVGSRAFARFHNPGLPSLVIVGPEGSLAGFHSGVTADLVGTVREEVRALLE